MKIEAIKHLRTYQLNISTWLICLLPLSVCAQNVATSCPDFTNISAPYVTPTIGNVNNPFETIRLTPSRHTLITTQGTDPNTNNLLQIIPTGETKVVRLGNENVGAQAEALSYHYYVEKEKSILQVKFAVVFEDPAHSSVEQPRFKIRITDKDGKLMGNCAEYDVIASQNLKGFNTYFAGGRPVLWRDWTSLVIDMSDYVGTEVQVQFVTYDCSQGGHFGYAYFNATCLNNNLGLEACSDSAITVTAPEGFASYLWDNGDTQSKSTRNVGTEDLHLSCQLTTEMGCSFTLSAHITANVAPGTVSTTIVDTICEGEFYTKNNFTIPYALTPGEHTFINSTLDPIHCSDPITQTLKLKVLTRYSTIKASICQGNNYTENGFNIIAPPAGMHYDTLVIARPGQCDIIIYLELLVNTSFNMSSTITGDTSPCMGKRVDYSFAGYDDDYSYTWNIPSNATYLEGQGSNTLSLVFNTADKVQLSFTGVNGCNSGTASIDIAPNSTYFENITDTICAGNEYHKYGFMLSRQDGIGRFVYINKFKSIANCDSSVILELIVIPMPKLRLEVGTDSVICNGQTAFIKAFGDNASQNVSLLPRVMIGDILCSDSSFVKPTAYIASGKQAIGIVFYVDHTGSHGWAVNLNNNTSDLAWSSTGTDVSGLTNFSSEALAITDLDGDFNTQTIRLAGVNYPAAYNTDINGGWYLPSYGQLKILQSVSYILDNSFVITAGSPILSGQTYHSSTEYNASNVWYISGDGSSGYNSKSVLKKIRQVRSF